LRTFTNPPPPSTGPGDNLADDLARRATEQPDSTCLTRYRAEGWVDVSAASVHAEVVALARGLLAAGIEAGDRVLVCSRTRYEWTLLDYACWEIGAVVVPVYATSPAQHPAAHHDCGARRGHGWARGAAGNAGSGGVCLYA